GSNHTFLLNHYPVSTMLYGRYERSFADLARGVSVFLCGHLHQLVGGIGAQLQAYKAHEGFWELEIGDMKEHALYRVYAIDNDLVSFVDVTLPLGSMLPLPNPRLLDAAVPEKPIPHPPVVLVTNPKDARYLLPLHEPLAIMRGSTHIRALVWADCELVSVTMSIDGGSSVEAVYRGKQTTDVDGDTVKTPLWVAPWDASQYDDGQVHSLLVVAVDAEGKRTEARTPFHFAAVPVPLENDARGGWIMRQSFPALFRVSGLISYLLATVFLLLVPRVYFLALRDPRAWMAGRTLAHHRDEARIRHLRAAGSWWGVKRGLALVAQRTQFLVATQFTAQVYFASVGWLFYPAYFFAMAVAVLPLFTGLLIPSSGTMGSVYAYGVFVAGEWAPLLDSWTYALTTIISLSGLLVYLPVAAAPPALFYSPFSAGGSLPWYRAGVVRVAVALFCVVYLGLPTLMTVYTYGFVSIVCGYSRAWLFGAAT
ncbi:hypothetical protein IWW38_005278, partial [Coemansia aciculifera]